MNKTKVKICCISSTKEAELAIDAGATSIGLVGPMPSGPGIIDNDLIAAIAKSISNQIDTVLLTSETTAEGIINHYQKINTTSIQLVDKIRVENYVKIRKALPAVRIIQVIHVLDHNSIKEALSIEKHVDAILLDSGNPNLTTKELGGTGRTHNWDLSREICDVVSIPLFLAGGLNDQNIIKAIRTVQPYGVDLCSGVRTDGKLDSQKLTKFFDELSKANS